MHYQTGKDIIHTDPKYTIQDTRLFSAFCVFRLPDDEVG